MKMGKATGLKNQNGVIIVAIIIIAVIAMTSAKKEFVAGIPHSDAQSLCSANGGKVYVKYVCRNDYNLYTDCACHEKVSEAGRCSSAGFSEYTGESCDEPIDDSCANFGDNDDPNVRGSVQGYDSGSPYGPLYDECESSTRLTEYYCSGDSYRTKTYACDCVNGVCVQSTTTTSATTTTQDYDCWVYGTPLIISQSVCVADGETVVRCEAPGETKTFYVCSNGDSCTPGEVAQSNEKLCCPNTDCYNTICCTNGCREDTYTCATGIGQPCNSDEECQPSASCVGQSGSRTCELGDCVLPCIADACPSGEGCREDYYYRECSTTLQWSNWQPPTLGHCGIQCEVDAGCDDNNECTDDDCTNYQCINTPLNGLEVCSVGSKWGNCVNGACMVDGTTTTTTQQTTTTTDGTTTTQSPPDSCNNECLSLLQECKNGECTWNSMLVIFGAFVGLLIVTKTMGKKK